MKVEMPWTATDDGGGDGDVNDCCDYGLPKKEPKEELDDCDGDAVDVKCYYDCDPPKDEPDLVATGDDTDDGSGTDVGYDCSHCGISLSTREFKVTHELRCKVRMEQKELESQVTKLYHCCYCRCPFVSQEFKERHQQKWCPKRPIAKRKDSNGTYFACDRCEYVAKWKHNLEAHVLTHNKTKAEWFACTQCLYKTVRKGDMTRHMKIHNNSFSCCCPICGESFRSKRCLDSHLLRRHSDEWDEVSKLITSKLYTCSICGKYRTVMKANLNRHLTITHHKGVGCEKYECPRCPYSTFHEFRLKTHSKMHAEQKDYRCSVCKKQFARKQVLDSHILYIHSDNVDLMKTITSKIHRCESCSFQTVHKTHLKSHVRSKRI